MASKNRWVPVAGSILAASGMIGLTGVGVSSAATSKTITIAYQQFGGGHQTQDWLTSVKTQFEKKYPGDKVVLEPINASENQYYTKLDLMNQSAKTAPDVMVEDTFLVNSDASAGYLMPLNKYVKTWPDWNKDYYPPMQKAAESTNGTIYGIPFNTDTRGLWYDKVLFKKIGLPANWQPHSWADILKAATLIKKKAPGVTPLWFYSGTPMGEASTMQGFEMLLYGTHNTLYDGKTKKWIVSSPGFLDSLKFIQTIFKTGLAESLQNALTPNSSTIASQQLMPKQKVGILLDGEWEFSNWEPTGPAPWPNWYKVYGLAKMPKQNGGGFTSMSGGWTLSMSSKTQHAAEAWDFIKLATNKTNTLKIDLLDGNVTPRKDVAAMKQYKKFQHGILSRAASFNAFTYFRPAYAQYPSISNDIQTAMESVMTGGSPEQAMKQYAKQVTKYVGAKNVETIK